MKAILNGTTLKISAETEQEGKDLKVWLDRNIGREGDMEFDTSTSEEYSRSMDEIREEIAGDRDEYVAKDMFDVRGLGFGLVGPLPGSDESEVKADHYVISSSACYTKDDAIKEFWEDYKEKGPYGDGDIFWRRLPEMEKECVQVQDFYQLRCRFSIVKP